MNYFRILSLMNEYIALIVTQNMPKEHTATCFAFHYRPQLNFQPEEFSAFRFWQAILLAVVMRPVFQHYSIRLRCSNFLKRNLRGVTVNLCLKITYFFCLEVIGFRVSIWLHRSYSYLHVNEHSHVHYSGRQELVAFHQPAQLFL